MTASKNVFNKNVKPKYNQAKQTKVISVLTLSVPHKIYKSQNKV